MLNLFKNKKPDAGKKSASGNKSKKLRKPKSKKKNEIRMNRISGHPAYVYLEKGDEALTFGMTHSPETRKKKNVRLIKNPNPNDSEPSHVLPDPIKVKKKNLKKKKEGWKVSRIDKDRLSKLKNKKNEETRK